MAESIFDGILWPVPEPPKPDDPFLDHPFVKPALEIHAQIKNHEHVQSLFSQIQGITGLEVDHHHGTTALIVTAFLAVLIVLYLLFFNKRSNKLNKTYLKYLINEKIRNPHPTLGEDSDISKDLNYYNIYADTIWNAETNETLLHLTCQLGNVRQTENLLKRGGSKDLKNSNGQTPTNLVQISNNKMTGEKGNEKWSELIELLLSHGHNSDFIVKTDPDLTAPMTFLEYVISIRDRRWIKKLLSADRPSTWVQPNVNRTSTTINTSNGNEAESSILKGSGGSLLHAAVKEDDLELCRLLVKNGIHVNELDRNGIPAIMYANSEEVILLLINHGNDNAYIQPENKTTLLHIACEHNLVSVVEKLMSLNKDLREKAEAFKKADIAGSDIMVGYVDVNAQDINNTTPLQFASEGGSEGSFMEIMMLLLLQGADPNLNDNTDRLPVLFKAITDMNNSLVEHLIRGSQPPNDLQILADVSLIYQDEGLERRNALHYVTYGKKSPELQLKENEKSTTPSRRSSISAFIGSVSDVFSAKKKSESDALPSAGTARVSDTRPRNTSGTSGKVIRKSIRKSVNAESISKGTDGNSSDDSYGDGDFEDYESDTDGQRRQSKVLFANTTKSSDNNDMVTINAASAKTVKSEDSDVDTIIQDPTSEESTSSTYDEKDQTEANTSTNISSEVDDVAMVATPPPPSHNSGNDSGYGAVDKSPLESSSSSSSSKKEVKFGESDPSIISPGLDLDIITTSTTSNNSSKHDGALTPPSSSGGGYTPVVSTPVASPIPAYKGTSSTMSEIDVMNGIAFMLLKKGCDPDYCDANQISAISLATMNGYEQIAITMKTFSKKSQNSNDTSSSSVFSSRRWSIASSHRK